MQIRDGTLHRLTAFRNEPSLMTNRPKANNSRVWGCLALLALGMPLALLGACATGDKPKPAVAAVQSVLQVPGKAVVAVSNRNDGAAVLLETAQELRVDLQLSAWEVSNNFEWSIAELKPGVLDPIGSRFERSRGGFIEGMEIGSDGFENVVSLGRVSPQASDRNLLIAYSGNVVQPDHR